MKNIHLISLLKQYSLGCVLTIIIIGLIHLYSIVFESHFRYATPTNIIVITLICGFPFGISIWAWLAHKK